MSFDLSKQSRQLTISNAPVTVSLLICHVYLNDQLLRMSKIWTLIERKAVIFLHGIVKKITRKLSRYPAHLKCCLEPLFLLPPETKAWLNYVNKMLGWNKHQDGGLCHCLGWVQVLLSDNKNTLWKWTFFKHTTFSWHLPSPIRLIQHRVWNWPSQRRVPPLGSGGGGSEGAQEGDLLHVFYLQGKFTIAHTRSQQHLDFCYILVLSSTQSHSLLQ